MKTVHSNGTRYSFYTLSGKLIYELIDGESRAYYYASNRLIAQSGKGGKRFIHTDILGSTAVKTNNNGNLVSSHKYKPFGSERNSQTNEIGYTGHKFDKDIGLNYMQARYYDPVIGRFYSNDPKGFSDVYNFNRYAYAANNPYKYVDPDGKAVVYIGLTGGANAGASVDGAGGVFLDISMDGIKFGTYTSGEVGSDTTVMGTTGGVEIGGSTGGHEIALNGPYMTAGATGVSGVGGSVGGTSTLGPNSDKGIQVTVEIGTPQAGAYLHTGYGNSEVLGSLTGDDVRKGLQSAGESIQSTMDSIAEALTSELDINPL